MDVDGVMIHTVMAKDAILIGQTRSGEKIDSKRVIEAWKTEYLANAVVGGKIGFSGDV